MDRLAGQSTELKLNERAFHIAIVYICDTTKKR